MAVVAQIERNHWQPGISHNNYIYIYIYIEYIYNIYICDYILRKRGWPGFHLRLVYRCCENVLCMRHGSGDTFRCAVLYFFFVAKQMAPSFFVLEDNVCFEPHHNQRCKIMKIYEVYAATTLDIHKEKNCVVYVDVSNG